MQLCQWEDRKLGGGGGGRRGGEGRGRIKEEWKEKGVRTFKFKAK